MCPLPDIVHYYSPCICWFFLSFKADCEKNMIVSLINWWVPFTPCIANPSPGLSSSLFFKLKILFLDDCLCHAYSHSSGAVCLQRIKKKIWYINRKRKWTRLQLCPLFCCVPSARVGLLVKHLSCELQLCGHAGCNTFRQLFWARRAQFFFSIASKSGGN